MDKNFRKFGSPYDPKYAGRGKIEKPQEAHKLRGCGDPNCPECNPHTAGAANVSPNSNPSKSGGRITNMTIESNPRGFGAFDLSTIERAMMRELMDNPRVYFSGGSVPVSNGPSAAYKAAREAVKDWIAPAPEQAFEDIIGNDDALAQLRDAIRGPVENKDLYEAYGLKMPKGALLSGPPGCGKTMFARAAVSEMKRLYGDATEFISISGTEIQSPYVGVTEGYIKAIFTFAREYKASHGHPLLVFIDEAEVLLPDRTGRTRRVMPWEESNVATFLAEMDGMRESGAFVLLATNRPGEIDQAVLRDGRCDFKISVKRPTAEAVEMILRKNFSESHKLADLVDDLVFAAVECFSDPAKVIVEAHMIQVRNGKLADLGGKNFTLEHIVSGAMAASVPTRAARIAFARDKAAKTITGVTVSDVVAAVNALFDENRTLDHSFALDEFKAEFEAELRSMKKLI